MKVLARLTESSVRSRKAQLWPSEVYVVGRYHAQMFGTRVVEAWWEGFLLAGALLASIYVYWTVIFSVPSQERRWPAWVVAQCWPP